MREAKAAGVKRVAFSLDAPDAELHDRFRGFPGSFERTLAGIAAAAEAGLPLQINTTACRLNAHVVEKMIPTVTRLGAVMWSVFFLVPTGRGKRLAMISAQGHDRLIRRLDRRREELPFDLKFTAAPQHRRIQLERRHADG